MDDRRRYRPDQIRRPQSEPEATEGTEGSEDTDDGCGWGCLVFLLLIAGFFVLAWWMGWLGTWWDWGREAVCELCR